MHPLVHGLLVVMVIALPFSKAVASCAVILLLFLSLIQINKQTFQAFLQQKPGVLLFTGMFFIYLLGMLYTEQKASGWHFVFLQHSFLSLPIILWINHQIVQRYFRSYLRYFVWAATLSGIFILIGHWLPESLLIQITDQCQFLLPYQNQHGFNSLFGAYSPFIERLTLSYLLALAVLVLMWLASKDGFRWYMVICATFLLISLLVLGGRGGQLGLLAALIIWIIGAYQYFLHPYLVDRIGKKMSFMVLSVGLFAFSVGTPYATFKTVPEVGQRYNQLFYEIEQYFKQGPEGKNYEHFTSVRRVVSWKYNWTLIQQNFLFGVGTGDIRQQMKSLYEEANQQIPVNIHHQFLFYWGITGLLGFCFFSFLLIFWLFQTWQHPSFWWRVFCLSLLVFYLAIMQADAPLLNQVGSMTFCWLMGMGLIREH